jgi:hypothetical protein
VRDFKRKVIQVGYHYDIPQRTKETIDNYVQHGIPMGGFLKSVFSNNLVGAVGSADNENYQSLKAIIQYMYCETPSICWGDVGIIKAWINHSGLKGMEVSDG